MSVSRIRIEELYERISLWKEIIEDHKGNKNFDLFGAQNKIEELKREIRAEYRKSKWGDDTRYYDGRDCESYRLYYDEYFDSPEDAKEWARETYDNGNPCRYYDWSPTGLWFISDVRVAHIEGDRYRVMIQRNIDI